MSQLRHFHLGFNEKENVLLLNHFLDLVTVISIQQQEGLAGTMKRRFNTCKFLETFTCHMLHPEFELCDRMDVLLKPTLPASQRMLYAAYLRRKKVLGNMNTWTNGPCTHFHLSRQFHSLLHILFSSQVAKQTFYLSKDGLIP